MRLIHKLILIGLLLALGLVLHLQQGLASAWYLYAAALLLVLSHLLMGNVGQAWSALQKGDQARARKLLGEVWQPEWLLPAHRGRYYLTAGLLALHQKDLEEGRRQLERALEIGALPELDKAVALLNLAHVQMVQGQREVAARLLNDAERHAGKTGPVLHQIRKARAMLSQNG